jgi:hypothetical protein
LTDTLEIEKQPPLTPDMIELGELCGCTAKQIKFAEGLLQGMNFTEAAFHAGYAGERDSVQLRSAGSSAARAKPVQALLALSESRGLGVPNAPGDVEELVRILWGHARSKDKAHSIKAAAELKRIMDDEYAAKDAVSAHDMVATLNEIAEIAPAYAVLLSSKHSIDWKPSAANSEAVEKARREIAMAWLEEQRAKTISQNAPTG